MLGMVNVHLSQAFKLLVGIPSLDIDVHMDLDDLHNMITQATPPAEAIVHANITVYRLRDLQEAVGNCLSDFNVILQQPAHQRPQILYENPHFLACPETQRDEDIPIDQIHRSTEMMPSRSSVPKHETEGRSNLPEALDPRAPTDSGYASTTYDKARLMQSI